jgi:hypothetical protein
MPPHSYLNPYLTASRRFGGTFGTLLWASTQTQEARFEALMRGYGPRGQSVLDVGCGRADFLDFCIAAGMSPADYVGIEAVGPLADRAAEKQHATIIRADFVQQPAAMFVGADAIYFSGSLNTLDDPLFYATIRRAFDATARAVVFNFLSSSQLAAAAYLYWRHVDEVMDFVRTLTSDAVLINDYLEGDATVAICK